ncbi:MAG TPA: hypothetical protein GX706_02345 [Candidatus Moranbacteria bacterium]|nr:hypothetical protein [Candidatus Moranbacteria bacterium]
MKSHKLIFAVARDEKEVRFLAKKKWVAEKLHVYGAEIINHIDGYKVFLKKS